ncbi:hypothetical protein M0804_014507 [Polistes exclamans]|nr:hypothetical protein M0804_014508 [Polistes exclamans]KAI4475120.1 hypothetical protein M0804_014507 [Polistes exclamans]
MRREEALPLPSPSSFALNAPRVAEEAQTSHQKYEDEEKTTATAAVLTTTITTTTTTTIIFFNSSSGTNDYFLSMP